MAELEHRYDQDRLDRVISTTSGVVEASKADVERTQAISEVFARLAYAIDTMDAPPRFYFHFHAEGHCFRDHCGVELPDLATAREWGEAEARHLLEPEWPLGLDPMTGVITIADDDGNTLAQVVVRDVLARPA